MRFKWGAGFCRVKSSPWPAGASRVCARRAPRAGGRSGPPRALVQRSRSQSPSPRRLGGCWGCSCPPAALGGLWPFGYQPSGCYSQLQVPSAADTKVITRWRQKALAGVAEPWFAALPGGFSSWKVTVGKVGGLFWCYLLYPTCVRSVSVSVALRALGVVWGLRCGQQREVGEALTGFCSKSHAGFCGMWVGFVHTDLFYEVIWKVELGVTAGGRIFLPGVLQFSFSDVMKTPQQKKYKLISELLWLHRKELLVEALD